MTAAVGIDYGTSNSEVVFFDGQHHINIDIDPASQTPSKIRSSVFIHYEDDLPLPDLPLIEAKMEEIQRAIGRQLDKAKDGYYEAKDPGEQKHWENKINQLRGDFHNRTALQQRAIQVLSKDMSVDDLSLNKLVETGEFALGEEGFKRFLSSPEKGRLIYSPKNFLGATLSEQQKGAFVGLIAKQLSYFKNCAEEQLNQAVTKAVLGRPVRFHGTRGEQGNQQALEIMRQAATEAGFEHVDFLEEPIAAAYKIESQLDSEKTVLVVDIGGGTTDVCCIKLSPEKVQELHRQKDVLAVTGTRLGGMECDKNLITKVIAPHMGAGTKTTNGLPVPPTFYTDMCAVDDIPKLNSFFSDDYGLNIAQTRSIAERPELLDRLLTVQEEKLSARLVNSARMAKELLSSYDNITLPLKYVEPDFQLTITEEQLNTSMQTWLRRVIRLVTECLEQSAEAPELLFVTGGMSLSPLVQKELLKLLPDLDLVTGDAFNSVSEGLSIQASKL